MPSGQVLRENLFASHVADLQSLCPEAARVFICPICFGVFTEDSFRDHALTDGHVWSEAFVRQYGTSKRAKKQRVLLCEDCNSKSGLRGEGALTQFEAFRRTREAGQFFRPSMQVFPSGRADNPAEIGSVSVEFSNDKKSLATRFPVHKKSGHTLYSPKEKQTFEQYFARGPCTVIVAETYPLVEKWQYAQVALLTSAYVFDKINQGHQVKI